MCKNKPGIENVLKQPTLQHKENSFTPCCIENNFPFYAFD